MGMGQAQEAQEQEQEFRVTASLTPTILTPDHRSRQETTALSFSASIPQIRALTRVIRFPVQELNLLLPFDTFALLRITHLRRL